MIEVERLTKQYGHTVAVDGLSFAVRPGVVTGFLGPNGSGKSTTMRMILGLDRPSAGRALIEGCHYRDPPSPLRTVGALLDRRAVHPGRSAGAHLLVSADPGSPRTILNRVIPEAQRLFSGQYAPIMPAFAFVYDLLVNEYGCSPYVKTQYVGFDLNGRMVASAHPRGGDSFELALALPEDHESALLHDASHLKWRSLPVSVEIQRIDDVTTSKDLIQEAVSRINAGVHNVRLANTRFRKDPKIAD